MLIALDENHVELTASESDDGLFLLIDVAVEGFSARHELWFDAEDVSAFAAALRRIDHDRSGDATLSSVDTRQFQLRVAITDLYGHVDVSGWLNGFSHGTHGRQGGSLEYQFSVHQSQLEEFAASAHVLLADVAESMAVSAPSPSPSSSFPFHSPDFARDL